MGLGTGLCVFAHAWDPAALLPPSLPGRDPEDERDDTLSRLFILMTRLFMNILQTVSQAYSCRLCTNITEEVRRYEYLYNPSLKTYKDVQMTILTVCGATVLTKTLTATVWTERANSLNKYFHINFPPLVSHVIHSYRCESINTNTILTVMCFCFISQRIFTV